MDKYTRQVLTDIRKHCLECSGGSTINVERCLIKRCSLYPYRTAEAAQRANKAPIRASKKKAVQIGMALEAKV